MQIYIDMLKEQMQKGRVDPKNFAGQVTALGLDSNDQLAILRNCCDLLLTIHYVAGVHKLPLDAAYSSLLCSKSIFNKDSSDPIENIYAALKAGKLDPPASPIHAVMERLDRIERGQQ